MILGFGLDLCDQSRMEKALARERFLERVYTPGERTRILNADGPRRLEIAAGLFAAKEAVAKALGTGFSCLGPWDIQIAPDGAGRPVCTLTGTAAKQADDLCSTPGRWRMHVTITHEGGMAAAAAILEG